MTLEQDAGIDGVELGDACQVDIGDNSVEDIVEVIISSLACIDIVEGCDTIKIIHIFLMDLNISEDLSLLNVGICFPALQISKMC